MDWSYAVYQTVQTIPYGRVTTYGHIASLLGERLFPSILYPLPCPLAPGPWSIQYSIGNTDRQLTNKHNDHAKSGRVCDISPVVLEAITQSQSQTIQGRQTIQKDYHITRITSHGNESLTPKE